jgi:superfamily II DNA or RNA helicase
MICEAVGRLVQAGRRVLVLVREIEHGIALEGMLLGSKFVQAADGLEVRETVAKLDRGELRCVIGSPVVGEGLDCPAADALVYAKGGKARVTHTQDIFRVLTGYPGKREALIIDFCDRHNRTLLEHSIERMKNYVEIGGHVRIIENAVDLKQGSLLEHR